ncbi:hypothetical protein [Ammoniphilus sp. 3BR4]|uniref:hypothetical protein n=1 Tax=Ammoniphilus sp. 3BR4 TaxID=3158265 RepID=UPI0034656340
MIKGLWLWETNYITSKDVITFCKAGSFNLLFLHIDTAVPHSTYQTFLKTAYDNGIEIHALGGRRGWALTKYRKDLDAFINWVNNYQTSSPSTERFKGVHLDIEPYTLPEWAADEPGTVTQWMDAVTHMITQFRSTNIPISIGASVPHWLHTRLVPNTAETLSHWMISKYDYLALMSYRNVATGSNSVVSIVQEELTEADALGKSIFASLETGKSNEGPHISFYNKGRIALEKAIPEIDAHLQSHPSYKGIMIHSFKSLRDLSILGY